MKKAALILGVGFGLMAAEAWANEFPRVNEKLQAYETEVKRLESTLDGIPADPDNKDWVVKRIGFLYARDQFARKFFAEGYAGDFSEEEKRFFGDEMNKRISQGMREAVGDLKTILRTHKWVTITNFGARTDNEAWIIIANADFDRPFQKDVLSRLEGLWERKESSPRNYAFLFDQLAVADGKRQRYGTQGRCVGPEKWEPHTIENPAGIDTRREKMGMEPLADYVARFKEICK